MQNIWIGWLRSYFTFLYSSPISPPILSHVQNVHTYPYPLIAVCSSYFHCSPQRFHETSLTTVAVVITVETPVAAQRQLELNLNNSVSQLSTLQSSWLCKGSALLKLTLKGQTTQNSLLLDFCLGSIRQNSQQSLGWQIVISPQKRSLVTRKKTYCFDLEILMSVWFFDCDFTCNV